MEERGERRRCEVLHDGGGEEQRGHHQTNSLMQEVKSGLTSAEEIPNKCGWNGWKR